MQIQTSILAVVLTPIITAVVSAFITYYLAMRSKKNEAMLKFKEEKYSRLLVLLQGFVGQTATSALKKEFFEEQYKSWLYCSDEVVIAINQMLELIISHKGTNPDRDKGKQAVGNIVLAMRKDLLGKTNLKNIDFSYTDVLK